MLEKFNLIYIKKDIIHASIRRHDNSQVKSNKATLISEHYQNLLFLVSSFSTTFGKECTGSLKIAMEDLLLLKSLLPYSSTRNLQSILH